MEAASGSGAAGEEDAAELDAFVRTRTAVMWDASAASAAESELGSDAYEACVHRWRTSPLAGRDLQRNR